MIIECKTEYKTEFSLSFFPPQAQKRNINHETPLCVGSQWLRSEEQTLCQSNRLQSCCKINALQHSNISAGMYGSCMHTAVSPKLSLENLICTGIWGVFFSLKLDCIKNTVEILWCSAPPALLSNTRLHVQTKQLSKGWFPSSRVFLIIYCMSLILRIFSYKVNPRKFQFPLIFFNKGNIKNTSLFLFCSLCFGGRGKDAQTIGKLHFSCSVD